MSPLPERDYPSIDPVTLELGMIRHVDDTEHRIMGRMDELHTQFNAATSEIRETHAQDLRYFNERINTVETNLTNKLDQQAKDINTHFESLGEKMSENFNKLDTRITVVERWQWLIVGGSVVVLFLFSNYVLKHLGAFMK